MNARLMSWRRLDMRTPLKEEQVTAALTALATLSGSPFVTLEARGAEGQVTWRVGCDAHHLSRVLDALTPHLPGLQVSDLPDREDLPDAAARLALKGSAHRPLGSGVALTTTRSLLAALARAGRHESLTLQLTLGPRQRPEAVPEPKGRVGRDRAAKWGGLRFGVDLRVGAVSDDPARVHTLVGGVIAAVRTLEVPGVGVSAVRTSIDGFNRVSLPWFWRSVLAPSELVSLTAWPIGTPPLPGVPSPHPVRLTPDRSLTERGLVLGKATALLPKGRPVAIKPADQLQGHLHLIGPTGVGKSTLLASLALQDIEAGFGLCFIDPKGDAVEELLARIPSHRLGDVVVIDPRDPAPVGLASLRGSDPDRTADALLAVFHSLYADNWGPRSHDIIHAGLLTLARRGDASLVLLPTLLTNTGFRRSVTQRIVRDDPLGLGTFWGWYESLSEAERQQAIAPVMNKLRPILLRPGMRHTLGQRAPKFELRDLFDKNRIVLVSLAKGQLGPESAALLGSLVVALLWDTITARAAVESSRRTKVGIYIDEVQDYLRLPGDLGDALAQARGYGVKVALAHQHLGQLGPSLREAVLANARSRVMFGLSHRDAAEFARMSRGQVETDDLELLPAHEAYAALLVDGAQAPWVSITTAPLGPVLADPKDVRTISRTSYGVPAAETDADLRGFTDPPAGPEERFGRTPRSSS
jgi:hypothetical protein